MDSRLTRRGFVKGVGAAAAACAVGAAEVAEAAGQGGRRPNVLFILPDEWRGQALGCMGDVNARTPHVDRLASEGVLLSNVVANTPVCCPARAVMLSGTYTSTNGMVANDLRLRENVRTMAHSFADAGYQTAYIGKWHLDGGPREPGFVPAGPRRHGFQYWAANECNHDYFYNWYFRDTELVVSHEYEPVFWTDEAVRFLDGREGEKPFFLMVSIGAPHDPYVAPESFMQKYDPAKIVVRPNWQAVKHGDREDLAGYYAAIEAVDEQIGRLLAKVEELKLAEDTIVLFSSDHGNMLGSQGALFKRKPYEESAVVPGVVRWPGKIAAGTKSELLWSHVDFAPTLLAMCGVGVPKAMQGADCASSLVRGGSGGPESAFLQIFGPCKLDGVKDAWRGVRTARWTYARTESGPWLLFDREADPYEMTNLVGEPAAADMQRRLDAEVREWMQRVGDSWALDWHEFIEDGGGLFAYEAFYTPDEYLAWKKAHPRLARTPAQSI
jgi:arylsulfatase A-like enzyme